MKYVHDFFELLKTSNCNQRICWQWFNVKIKLAAGCVFDNLTCSLHCLMFLMMLCVEQGHCYYCCLKFHVVTPSSLNFTSFMFFNKTQTIVTTHACSCLAKLCHISHSTVTHMTKSQNFRVKKGFSTTSNIAKNNLALDKEALGRYSSWYI